MLIQTKHCRKCDLLEKQHGSAQVNSKICFLQSLTLKVKSLMKHMKSAFLWALTLKLDFKLSG